jgi:precorrin-6Y C5,15-methyltransferase (decarboxylating)
VLASGDPGFFGIVRTLSARFGGDALRVHPAPSSVALAFARLGVHWDDAAVVSAHGRELHDAVAQLRRGDKAAVLCSPANPPEVVAGALADEGHGDRRVAVFTRLGEPGEARVDGTVREVAAGTFDPMSVLVLPEALDARAGGDSATLAWGLPETAYEHRDGMITKAEVRAIVVAKLALPRTGVLWDVGAGSGSVGIECARLAPALQVFAIEHDADSAARVRANAARYGVAIDVVEASAPGAFSDLPDPDRVFVGGGGMDALDAAQSRLRPGGVVVATYALLDRAVAAYERLGYLSEVAVSRGVATGEHGVRLRAENPVFVAWNDPAPPEPA